MYLNIQKQVSLTLFLCLLAILPLSINAQSDTNHKPNIDPGEFTTRSATEGWMQGYSAPDIAFNDVNGKKFTLHGLLTKPTVIEFYSLDCQQCAKNKNYLKSFYRQYDINIVSICTDDGYPAEINKRAKAAGVTWSNVMDDSKKFGGKTFAQTSGIPDASFVLILPDKNIQVISNNAKQIGMIGVELQKYFGK